MRTPMRALWPLAFALCGVAIGSVSALADAPAEHRADLKPEVAALVQKSTDVYKKMKTYYQTAIYAAEWKVSDTETKKGQDRFILALDRPNKFCYKCDTKPNAAAVSDGKTFFNFRVDQDTLAQQYTKSDAPADYKGINIVDDVVFEPLGTYIIALMLQGDATADKDVLTGLQKATVRPSVMEGGKKWDVLVVPFGPDETPTEIYINSEDHLIGKTITRTEQIKYTITETIENVKIDKPIDASVFQYTPPAASKQVEKFLPPQRPNDARRNVSGAVRIASAKR